MNPLLNRQAIDNNYYLVDPGGNCYPPKTLGRSHIGRLDYHDTSEDGYGHSAWYVTPWAWSIGTLLI
jgi:hypothetical protein